MSKFDMASEAVAALLLYLVPISVHSGIFRREISVYQTGGRRTRGTDVLCNGFAGNLSVHHGVRQILLRICMCVRKPW